MDLEFYFGASFRQLSSFWLAGEVCCVAATILSGRVVFLERLWIVAQSGLFTMSL